MYHINTIPVILLYILVAKIFHTINLQIPKTLFSITKFAGLFHRLRESGLQTRVKRLHQLIQLMCSFFTFFQSRKHQDNPFTINGNVSG